MKLIFIALLVCYFGNIAFAQSNFVTDTTKHKRKASKVFSTTYLLAGSGRYADQSFISSRKFSANLGSKIAYKLGYFYVNAGIGVYSLETLANYIPGPVSPVPPNSTKFLVELPWGFGYSRRKKRDIFQFGIDFPYQSTINGTKGENGLAIAPYFSSLSHKPHQRLSIGVFIKAMKNLQASGTEGYNPNFYGAGLVIRY